MSEEQTTYQTLDELKGALDTAITELDNAEKVAEVTPEYLAMRKRQIDYKNSLFAYRRAGGDKGYYGTLLREETAK